MKRVGIVEWDDCIPQEHWECEDFNDRLRCVYEEIGSMLDREDVNGSLYHWLRESYDCLDQAFLASRYSNGGSNNDGN